MVANESPNEILEEEITYATYLITLFLFIEVAFLIINTMFVILIYKYYKLLKT